jgi:hypothetical protein
MENPGNQSPQSPADSAWFVTSNGRKASTPMSEAQARAEAERLRKLQETQGGAGNQQIGVAQSICG